MVNRLRFACVALVAGGIAAVSTSASAVCLPGVSTVEAQQAFKADPGALLRRYPFGSGGLAGEIRNFIVSDASLLPATIGLVASANSRQKSAIAAGLAQAARACTTPDQAVSLAIQQAVAGLPDAELQTAFASESGDTQTAAVGGDSGPAGSPAGGGTPGSAGGGPRTSIERSTPTQQDSFSSSGGGYVAGTSGTSSVALNSVTSTSVSGP